MQNTGKKVGIFLLVIAILGGGYWYSQSRTSEMSNLDMALQRMDESQGGIQSLAIGSATSTNPITADDIVLFEKALPEAQPRLDRIRGTDAGGVHTPGYRDKDETKLKAIFTANNIEFANTNDIGKRILDKSRAIKDDYNNTTTGINSLIVLLPAAVTQAKKADIKALTDSINVLTTEGRLVESFKNWYSDTIRPNVCTTDDATFDIYKKGVTTFTYNTVRPTKADECVMSGQTAQVKQYKCVGVMYTESTTVGSENPKIETCPYGCAEGACRKAQLGTISLLNSNTNGTAVTSRQSGETFWIKLSPEKNAGTTTTAVITSPSFTAPAKCTLTTKTQTVATSGTALLFGPIVCNSAETHSFDVALKEGSTQIEKQTVTMPYTGITMDHFDVVVTNPAKIGVGTPVKITVKAIGSTGLIYKGYTQPFDVIIDDEDADYERKPYTLNPTTGTLEIKDIKFSKGGTFKILIRSGDVSGKSEAVVEVKTAPVASLSARVSADDDYQDRSISVTANDALQIEWSSSSFASATSNVTPTPNTCNTTWLNFNATTQSGNATYNVPANIATNCTWTITYTVKNGLTPQGTISDTLTITS